MISYLVFEAPGGPDRDHRSTRFVPDRFSWLAFLFPWLWFCIHRVWWAAIGTGLLQIAAVVLSNVEGFAVASPLTALAIGVLAGLEGRAIVQRRLLSKGWTLQAILVAPSLKTGEDMYFSNLPVEQQPATAIRHPEWTPRLTTADALMNDPATSFQFDLNGRR